MTPDEILLIDEKFKGLTSLVNAQFINVNERLDSIKEQTTRTNGRVTELERKEIKHVIECPVNPRLEPRIRTLEDNQLSALAIKKMLFATVTVTSGIVGIIWVVVKLIIGV